MVKVSMIFALLTICLLESFGTFVNARSFKGQCPVSMKFKSSFDMTKYLGKWYSQYRTPNDEDIVMDCMQTEIADGNGGYFLKISSINPADNLIKIKHMDVIDYDVNGRFKLKNQEGDSVPFPTWIVATDYSTYSIRFSCYNNDNHTRQQIAVLQTREENPPSELLNTLKNAASKVGINIKQMKPVSHDGCLPLES